jgi:hypothetical protein
MGFMVTLVTPSRLLPESFVSLSGYASKLGNVKGIARSEERYPFLSCKKSPGIPELT